MRKKNRISILSTRFALLPLIGFVFYSCTEVDYREVENPAYLRVFNDLNYVVTAFAEDDQLPYLTMLIDPVFDADRIPTDAAIVSDFLDRRNSYASPYPTHSESGTSVWNPEYPGREEVLVAPVVNGFDLSSWAQIPSGKHRFVFMRRPYNDISFFELRKSLKQTVLLDTTLTLDAYEVYTLNVLQKDFETKENGVILRKENFIKQPFSDSLVYVNFYNYSAKGFWQADASYKGIINGAPNQLEYGIQDTMKILMSLYRFPEVSHSYSYFKEGNHNYIGNYYELYQRMLYRNTESNSVAPYLGFPLFADTASNDIVTDMLESFIFIRPDMTGWEQDINDLNMTGVTTQFARLVFCGTENDTKDIRFYFEKMTPCVFPNMIVNTHSGIYNPRSFATVNFVEVVNGEAYLTTVQRRFDPPVY